MVDFTTATNRRSMSSFKAADNGDSNAADKRRIGAGNTTVVNSEILPLGERRRQISHAWPLTW